METIYADIPLCMSVFKHDKLCVVCIGCYKMRELNKYAGVCVNGVYKKRHPDFLWKISYKISDDSICKELSHFLKW